MKVERIEGGSQNVMRAHALQVACLRIYGRKEPSAAGLLLRAFPVGFKPIAQFGMNRYIGVNSSFPFESNNLKDVTDASVLREELISFQCEISPTRSPA